MTLKSDCIVSALQGFLSSNVLSYLCEMCWWWKSLLALA